MKNKDIIQLFNSLASLNVVGGKFNYGVAKNIAVLRPEVEAIDKAYQMTPEYKVYDDKRMELCAKLADKDEKNQPIIINNVYQITNKSEFDKEVAELQKEFPKEIEARKVQTTEYLEILEKETPVKLHKIKFEDVPNNLTTPQILSLMDLIED